MKVLNARECDIVRLLKEGLTRTAIAARLGLTRNTVSGVVYRLKAAGVPGIHFTGAKGKTSIKIKPAHKLRCCAAPAPTAAPAPREPVTILDLKRDSCRFILGRDLDYYCGQAAEVGSYCPTHRKICYTPRQTPA